MCYLIEFIGATLCIGVVLLHIIAEHSDNKDDEA